VRVDGESLCLQWSEESGAPWFAHGTPPPEGLACALDPERAAWFENTGEEPSFVPASGDYERRYVCVLPGDDGSCEPPEKALAALRCVEEVVADEGCGGWDEGTGACFHTWVTAACGPDPAAVGACCYYAIVELTGYYT